MRGHLMAKKSSHPAWHDVRLVRAHQASGAKHGFPDLDRRVRLPEGQVCALLEQDLDIVIEAGSHFEIAPEQVFLVTRNGGVVTLREHQ